MPPYEEKFPVGARVRVAAGEQLERFQREWRLHNPLQIGQLTFAGVRAVITDVGFYHGGDPLYRLDTLPGVWHETCLRDDMPLELESVVDLLDQFHQRATYGAVGGVVDRPPAFLMGGYPRQPRYSWIVNAETHLPTGHTGDQMHSSIRERERVIASAAELDEWIRNPS